MTRIALVAVLAAAAVPAFAATNPAPSPTAPTPVQIKQEKLMTSGILYSNVKTLWNQEDGTYENAPVK